MSVDKQRFCFFFLSERRLSPDNVTSDTSRQRDFWDKNQQQCFINQQLHDKDVDTFVGFIFQNIRWGDARTSFWSMSLLF